MTSRHLRSEFRALVVAGLVSLAPGATAATDDRPPVDPEGSPIPTVHSRASIPLNGLPIVAMAADLARPSLYVLEEEGVTARVLVVNTDSETIERVIPVGENVTDLDIHYPEARLYLTNFLRDETQRVNLHTQTVEPPLLLDETAARAEAGRAGRLYVRSSPYSNLIYEIIDTATGAQVGEIPDLRDFVDAEADPTGNGLFVCDEGDSGVALYLYDISTDDPHLVRASPSNPYGSETLLMVADGSRLFWNKVAYDANLDELYEYQDEILAATYRGHMAFSNFKAFDGFTGDLLAYLPVISEKMAVSGDQQKLFLWDAAGDCLQVVSIPAIAPVPALVPEPIPSDGATVPPPLMELRWSAMPHAQAYDVYLGTSAGQVAAATPGSAAWRGRVDDPIRIFSPPEELQLDTAYYWRVDVVSGGDPIAGPVWSFTTAPLRVSPSRVVVSGITGTPVSDRVLTLSTTAGSSSWTATVSSPWLDLSSAAGSTPSQVDVNIDTDGLPSGVHTASIDLVAGGTAFSVPVELNLLHLQAVAMVTDHARPYHYVLHTNGDRVNDSSLAFVRADTLELVKIIPVGSGATDLTINYFEARLYVNNSLAPRIRVVDLVTQSELAPLDVAMGTAVINAGRAGRIYVEDGLNWTNIGIVSTANGAIITTFPGLIYDGDGAVSPDGSIYYHGTGTEISTYDISTDTPTLIAEGDEFQGTDQRLVMSADGQRLFAGGHLFDAGLNHLRDFGVTVVATDTQGTRFVTEGLVVDATSGEIVAALPAPSTVSAFASDDERIIITDRLSGAITAVELPGPPLFVDGFESGGFGAWSAAVGGT
ncbi:MAG: hypothetical protein V2I67_04080 [Thermoanaerobaculales bacterium]|nr:hypothetical protein [Thermoanaerobaculales bacterium]